MRLAKQEKIDGIRGKVSKIDRRESRITKYYAGERDRPPDRHWSLLLQVHTEYYYTGGASPRGPASEVLALGQAFYCIHTPEPPDRTQ